MLSLFLCGCVHASRPWYYSYGIALLVLNSSSMMSAPAQTSIYRERLGGQAARIHRYWYGFRLFQIRDCPQRGENPRSIPKRSFLVGNRLANSKTFGQTLKHPEAVPQIWKSMCLRCKPSPGLSDFVEHMVRCTFWPWHLCCACWRHFFIGSGAPDLLESCGWKPWLVMVTGWWSRW